jgi:hypothetical protein
MAHISFYCDDIEKTVAELKARGVQFTAPVADHGYGLVTHFKAPGGFEVQLYQPRYVKRAGKKPAEKKPAAKKPAAKKPTAKKPAGKR